MTLVTMVLAVALQSTPPPQARDRATPAQTGTAVISGRILSETQPPRPVRRAAVLINNSDRTVGRTAITDDSGRFTVGALPPGRYSVEASKSGWVNTSFGAKAPGRPGRWITLADAERTTADIRIPRAGVITGTILDHNGQPPTGLTMRVLRYAYQFNTGERRLSPVAFTSWGPDERGAYRIWGLAPGDYYVSVYAGGAFTLQGRDLHLTSEVDVQEALRAAQSPSAPITDVVQPSVGMAPVFYPGTTVVAQATPVTIRAGEERSGVDFTMQYVSTAHVAGVVAGPDGTLPTGTQVNLIATDASAAGAFGFESVRTARPTGNEGRFEFAEVTPGTYVLAARAASPPAGPGMPPRVLWAMTDVEMQGEDVRGLSLQLQDGLTVSGVVQFDGDGPPPPIQSMRVNLTPAAGTSVSVSSGAGQVSADGRFTITGVTPGRYRLSVGAPSPQATWIVRSATMAGQESAETAVEVRQPVTDAVVTLTDRISQLSGRIVSPGAAGADYTVLVFPTNRAQWTAPSRRILTARTANDGSFIFRILPAGEYFLAALEDVEQGEWYDPAFLQRVAPAAMKITIAEGEKKVQDVQAGGG